MKEIVGVIAVLILPCICVDAMQEIHCRRFAEMGNAAAREIHARKKFSKDENDALISAVERIGTSSWAEVAFLVDSRNAKQCRERWQHYLGPAQNLSNWNEAEEARLVQLQSEFGNKWKTIALHFPGRSAATVKNHYLSLQRKDEGRSKPNSPHFTSQWQNDEPFDFYSPFWSAGNRKKGE
jgi:hypothetical protein